MYYKNQQIYDLKSVNVIALNILIFTAVYKIGKKSLITKDKRITDIRIILTYLQKIYMSGL